MTAADYVGIAGLITSSGAVAVSIIVALRQQTTHDKLDSVAHQVATSNGETIGEIVEKNDLLGSATHPPTVIPPAVGT